MMFSPGKKMAILMLLTILILSLLLGCLIREGMEDATDVINADAPTSDKQSVEPTIYGKQVPEGKKPITVSEITQILGNNKAIQDMIQKKPMAA